MKTTTFYFLVQTVVGFVYPLKIVSVGTPQDNEIINHGFTVGVLPDNKEESIDCIELIDGTKYHNLIL